MTVFLFGLGIHKHIRESTLSAKRIGKTKQTTTSGKEDDGRKGGKQDNEGKTTKTQKGWRWKELIMYLQMGTKI